MMEETPLQAEVHERSRQAFMERYKADRALELELSKFSGDLEKSFLQAAAVLNGGSATVFLSFIGSTSDKVRVDPYLLSMSFIAWVTGLTFALTTGWIAYQAQSGFIRAARNKRHVSGLEILGESYRLSMAVAAHDTVETIREHSNSLQRDAEKRWKQAGHFGLGSICLFGVGAILALLTVLLAAPIRHIP
jgi:CRP-like cAMP-binding protein